MKRTLLTLLLLSVSVIGVSQTPTWEVNKCKSVPELERVLSRLAADGDEQSRAALLWGSILYDGFRKRANEFPPHLLEAGRKAAFAAKVGPGTKAMQLWWLQTIGEYLPPDFRKAVIASYGTVLRNGRAVRVPVYRSAGEEEVAVRIKQLRSELLSAKQRPEEALLYLWWQRDSKLAPSSKEVTAVAKRMDSPFRMLAIGELALRERLNGDEGPWSAAWMRLTDGKTRPLVVNAMQTEITEAIRGN